jgi:hypothetical protein
VAAATAGSSAAVQNPQILKVTMRDPVDRLWRGNSHGGLHSFPALRSEHFNGRGVRTSRDQRANALSAFLLPDDEKREHRGGRQGYETDAFGWRAAPMFLKVDINLG